MDTGFVWKWVQALTAACRFAVTAAVLSVQACGGGGNESPAFEPVRIAHDFSGDHREWNGLYSDYSPGMENSIDFQFGPATVVLDGGAVPAYRLFSVNRSDDVWMFTFREIRGLRPSAFYQGRVTLTFASNASTGCAGIGGAPAESVTVKLGFASNAPTTALGSSGLVEVNFDKGNQSQGSVSVPAVGHIGVETGDCSGESRFLQKTLATPASGALAKADSLGRLWLVAGTDSGFEGRTELYLRRIDAALTPIP